MAEEAKRQRCLDTFSTALAIVAAYRSDLAHARTAASAPAASARAVRALLAAARLLADRTTAPAPAPSPAEGPVALTPALAAALDRVAADVERRLAAARATAACVPFPDLVPHVQTHLPAIRCFCAHATLLLPPSQTDAAPSSSPPSAGTPDAPLLEGAGDTASPAPPSRGAAGAGASSGSSGGVVLVPASGALRQLAAVSPACERRKGVSVAHTISSRSDIQATIASFQKAFRPYEEDARVVRGDRDAGAGAAAHGVVLAAGFALEIGSESLVAPPRPMLVADPAHFDQVYSECFFGYDHWNYVGLDPKKGPCVLSLVPRRTSASSSSNSSSTGSNSNSSGSGGSNAGGVTLVAFLRTRTGETQMTFTAPARKRESEPFGPQEALRAFRRQYPEHAGFVLEHVVRGELELGLSDYEEKFHTTKFKFGVLYAQGGQGACEDAMYGNEHGDALFDDFLALLGRRVALRGWDRYRGGLDVAHGATGTHSVYTDWRGFEIMLHVSTLLPFSAANPQQVERKRHLGNDIVVLVFHTGTGTLDPACFHSHFNHVFVVVRPVPAPATGDVRYRVTVALRGEVPLFPPHFPRDYLFARDELFREFILTKCLSFLAPVPLALSLFHCCFHCLCCVVLVFSSCQTVMNAELASLRSPEFAQRLSGVRRDMLNDFVRNFTTLASDKK